MLIDATNRCNCSADQLSWYCIVYVVFRCWCLWRRWKLTYRENSLLVLCVFFGVRMSKMIYFSDGIRV